MKKSYWFSVLFLVATNAEAFECTPASINTGLPTEGIQEVCVNNELYVVSAARAAIPGGNVPANVAQLGCDKSANFQAKNNLSKFIKEGKIKSTEFMRLYYDQGAGNSKNSWEKTEDNGNESSSQSNGNYSNWGNSYSLEEYSEFVGKSLAGITTVSNWADQNFCYSAVGISESSMNSAKRIRAASETRSVTKDGIPLSAGGDSTRWDHTDGRNFDRGYPTSVPSHKWVHPSFKSAYEGGR